MEMILCMLIGNDVGIQLIEQDLSWKDFLSSANHHPRYAYSNGVKLFQQNT